MTSFMTTYFGALTKDSCAYFLFLSMIFFAMLIITLIGEIIFIVKRHKELNFRVCISGLLLLFNSFLAYFVNRLLYTMCSKSL
jgi:predicted membrane protein